MFGKRFIRYARPFFLMSRYMQSSPVRFISESIERATMSRGARLPRGSYFFMNSLPCLSTRTAPSPRTASDMRKRLAWGWNRHVGWNWMNSMFSIFAPARHARAIPSPVAESGLHV